MFAVAASLLAAASMAPAVCAAQQQEGGRSEPPLYEERVSGLMVRITHRATAAGALSVEIWDLLVGPGERSEAITLPGAAVLSIRSGSGALLIGEEEQRATIGDSVTVEEGAELRIDNSNGDTRLAARAIVVARR